MTKKKLDRDLIEHAREQLHNVALKHVRAGMGPASAARSAIRETQALFPHDWRFGVQGDDDEEAVEVWEIEHKYAQPITRIARTQVEEIVPRKKTTRRSAFSAGFHGTSKKSAHATKRPKRRAYDINPSEGVEADECREEAVGQEVEGEGSRVVKLKLKAGDPVTVNLPGVSFHGKMFEFVRYNGRHQFAIVRVTKRFDDYSKGDELRLTGTLLAALEKGAA